MSSAEIAQMFHFTSTSYFNRYVKRYLGVYPSELRGQ
jgi:AraC-like DNA-binding protein